MLANKALWVIERHLEGPLTLATIADACCVSKYHLAHAFGASTGLSVMRYVRGRRLTVAAQHLSAGAPDILGLALDSGYGSHEAFSRAFRTQFGVTPEMVREKADMEDLLMVKAKRIPEANAVQLDPPRIVSGGPMLVVGLSERHSFETTQEIPAQWQRFMALYNEIPHKAGPIPLGVVTDMDEDGNLAYFCGVEVSKFAAYRHGLVQLSIPAQAYAVFQHLEHVSQLPATYSAILNIWLPGHNRVADDGPVLERHLETFDPRTGLGGVEVWIPLEEGA